MISSGRTCFDAIQSALNAYPKLWRHDLNLRWSERRQAWEVLIQPQSSSRVSSGIAGKATEATSSR